MHGQAALQVRQGERLLPITSVGGTDQVKEDIIFADRQKLSITKGPTLRGEVAAKYAYFSNKRTTHKLSPLITIRLQTGAPFHQP
jgi:hypothetical protein